MPDKLILGNSMRGGMIRQTGKSLSTTAYLNDVWNKDVMAATAKQSIHDRLMSTCRLASIPDTYLNITDDVIERYKYWQLKMQLAWNTALQEPLGATAHVQGFLAMISVWNFPTVNKAMEILLDVKNIPKVRDKDTVGLATSFLASLNDLLSLGIMYPELKIVEYFDLIPPAYENSLFVWTERGEGVRMEEVLRLAGLTQSKLSKLLYRVTESKLEYGHFISLMQRVAKNHLQTYVNALIYQTLNRHKEKAEECIFHRDAFDFHLWSRANQWADKISTVKMGDEKGTEIRVHHHSALWYVSQHYERDETVLYGGVERSMRELVHSFDPKSSPKRFYADIIKNIANSTFEKYNGMVFADFSEVLRNEVNGIRYIPTALEVLKEGDVMGHCVGGEEYVSGCVEGDTLIFHVDSPECPYGLTIALELEHWSKRSVTDEKYDTVTNEFFIVGEEISYRLITRDFTGRKNRKPSPEEDYLTFSKLCRVFGVEMTSPWKVTATIDRGI